MDRTDREFEGKDLAEALQAAAAALGIAEPELDYKILEQGRRGLFGLGARAVRIRVMPPVGGIVEVEPAPRPRPVERTAERPARRQAPKQRPARRPAPKRRSAKRPQKPDASPTAEAGSDVQATVQRMVELMGLELKVSARDVDAGVAVELVGSDRKLLLQKDGELISALQFLLNRMARRAWPGAGRIHLSCDGDRRRRDEDLVGQTREAAQEVARTGETRRLQPMNAYERRLAHITVREFPELDSRSEGQGFLKRVRIFRRK